MSLRPRYNTRHISRRSFLTGTALAAGTAIAAPLFTINNPQAWAVPVEPRDPHLPKYNIDSTTLRCRTVKASPGLRWSDAICGKPLPLLTRTELAKRRAHRPTTPLATIGQLSDLHITDSQSPARMEYVHSRIGNAYRPHECLTPFNINAAVKRLNKYNYGPIGGRKLDCVIMTGDGTDNHETIELEWMMKLLSGGSFLANTGSPTKWEGVETSGNPYYWQIQDKLADLYKINGFPTIDGFFDTLLKTPVKCPGLKTRWYSVLGNHDTCFIGTFPSDIPMDDFYMGDQKILDATIDDVLGKKYKDLDMNKNPLPEIMAQKRSLFTKVTPDPKRKPFTRKEFAEMHHRPEYKGAGPVGHGLPKNGLNFYTFPITDDILGITLDTNHPVGSAIGWLGGRQAEWMEQQIQAVSSQYYDKLGRLVKTGNKDKLVVVFSHHASWTILGTGVPQKDDPHDSLVSYSGAGIANILNRYPNVISWVNGHTHSCRIIPHPHKDARRSFWEINTPSFTDWPHMGRIIEIVDNNDSTLSLYTTLFESGVPQDPKKCTNMQDKLASLCRQIAMNDFENDWQVLLGTPVDGNTELVLANPLAGK